MPSFLPKTIDMKLSVFFILFVIFGILNSTYCQEPDVIIWKTSPTKSPLLSVVFSPDGFMLAAGGEDKTIYMSSLKTFSDSFTISNNYFPVKDLQFVNNNQILVANGPAIKLMDMESNLLKTFGGYVTHIWSFDYNPPSGNIIAGSYGKNVKILDYSSGLERKELADHKKSVLATALSPDGKKAVTGSLDLTVKIWHVDSAKVLHTMELHSKNILCAAFHPSGKYVATGSLDNTVRLWDVHTGKILNTFAGHTAGITAIVFSPENDYLLSGSYDKTIRLWDIYNGDNIYSFVDHEDVVNDLVFSPSGEQFASVADDGELILWRMDKAIFVEYYYYHELYDEKDNSGLFGDKRKSENREEYNIRLEKAAEKYQELVQIYYKRYLDERTKSIKP